MGTAPSGGACEDSPTPAPTFPHPAGNGSRAGRHPPHVTHRPEPPAACDVLVAGAGILGLAVAREALVRRPDASGEPRVLTALSAPAPALDKPLRLQTRTYSRDMPHLKHAGTFGVTRARREAVDAGYDDVLFLEPDGAVSEGSIWNIGFVENDRVIWPVAPMLAGTGQALLERGLEAVGLTSESRPVHRSTLERIGQAFICNSATPACAVAEIDGARLQVDPGLIVRLRAAWASNPLQTI